MKKSKMKDKEGREKRIKKVNLYQKNQNGEHAKWVGQMDEVGGSSRKEKRTMVIAMSGPGT
jgi:hypothetical protein